MCYDLPGGSRLSKKFLVGYPILKDFSYLFGAKFTGRKFYRWRHGMETSSLSRSLHDLMHWSSFRSLLRTYERSTYSKSKRYPPFEQLGPGHLRKSAIVSDLRGKSLKCRFNNGYSHLTTTAKLTYCESGRLWKRKVKGLEHFVSYHYNHVKWF